MNEQRFRELLEAYGANPVRWPENERQASQNWAAKNTDSAASLLSQASTLDDVLDQNMHADTDVSLLQARILRAAARTPQNASPANDEVSFSTQTSLMASWKSLAATLILTTGVGFGLGQAAAANTAYASAEALLSISLANDYEEADLSQDLQGDQP